MNVSGMRYVEVSASGQRDRDAGNKGTKGLLTSEMPDNKVHPLLMGRVRMAPSASIREMVVPLLTMYTGPEECLGLGYGQC